MDASNPLNPFEGNLFPKSENKPEKPIAGPQKLGNSNGVNPLHKPGLEIQLPHAGGSSGKGPLDEVKPQAAPAPAPIAQKVPELKVKPVILDPASPDYIQQLADHADDLIQAVLRYMVEKRSSDLHIRGGNPLIFRVDGNLAVYEKSSISPDLAKEILFHMITARQRKIFEAKNEIDFSFAVTGVGRFRGNAFRQRGTIAIVLRQIPTLIPTFDDLNLPPVLGKFCKLTRGLVLVCGVTGSGKSTTLAAMIDSINSDRAEHIVTIEDPIEFLYKDVKSIVSQRELGTDTLSFAEALKHVLRQDPDVILLGEMRDLETTSTAITAAQTGHLVLSTLHTTDAVQTINRIIDMYPPHQQQQVRFQLADVLKGVICQRLIPKASGIGRVPSCEVLVVTALAKKAIADNKMVDIQESIRQGQYYGMQSFHQSLLKLFKEGQIKLDDALEAASNPEELLMAIRGITAGSETLG